MLGVLFYFICYFFLQLKCRDYYSNRIPGVFGVTGEALTALLKDKSLRIDWSKPTVFNGQYCETLRGVLKPIIPYGKTSNKGPSFKIIRAWS